MESLDKAVSKASAKNASSSVSETLGVSSIGDSSSSRVIPSGYINSARLLMEYCSEANGFVESLIS